MLSGFRDLEKRFRVLEIIETAMSKRDFVPVEQIQKYAKLPIDRIEFTLGRLNKLGLIYSSKGSYVGHKLNYAGYHALAINALVKAGVIESFGQILGVGKEADVYDALSPSGERIAVKFHRLGRISFRQTQRMWLCSGTLPARATALPGFRPVRRSPSAALPRECGRWPTNWAETARNSSRARSRARRSGKGRARRP